MPFALPTRHDPAPSHDRLLRLTSPLAPHVDGDALREHSGIDVGQWVPLTGAVESDSLPPHDEGQGGSLLARLRSRVPASLRGLSKDTFDGPNTVMKELSADDQLGGSTSS